MKKARHAKPFRFQLTGRRARHAKPHSHSRKLHFSVQDMRYLPYADGSFEVVIAANVLHLLPEPDKALDEAARVLAPGGLLIVPTFTHAGEGRLAQGKNSSVRPCSCPCSNICMIHPSNFTHSV